MFGIPSTEEQYRYNSQLQANGDNLPLIRNSYRKPNVIGEPVILWKKSYETEAGKKEFLRVIQELSDSMLFNRSGLWAHDNPNQPELINAVKGKLNPQDYFTAEYTYGDKSNTPIRDNHFYYSSKNTLSGQVSSQPFQFSCKNISNELTKQQIARESKKAAKMASNMLVDYAAAAGQDISFIEDKKINMSGSKDEILAQLNDTEKLEYIIYKLVQDVNYRHDIRRIEKRCFESKFDINAEFAMIEVVGDDIRPKSLRPEQVRWIAGGPIETLEDESVIAASVVDYLTLTEILNKYGYNLNTGTGAAGIMDAIDKLQQGNPVFRYDPNKPYFSEYLHNTGLTSNVYDNAEASLDTFGRVDYNSYFYPFLRTTRGLSYTMLEQKMFFKMVKNERYAVEINGKKTTKAKYEEWLKSNMDRKLIATFRELDEKEKPKENEYLVNKPKVELWEATRLGHGTLINVGRYEYTTSKKGKMAYVGMPIVAQISYDKSFAKIGYEFALWTNVLFNRIEDILNTAGFTQAIAIDTAYETNINSFLFNAKRTGIALFNSSRFVGANQSPINHLQKVELGSNLEEANNMFSMIGMMKMLYESMIGASPQTQGVQQAYSSAKETQINIQNQSVLAQPKFYEHQLFMNQLLQRVADIAKKFYSRDDIVNIRISDEAHEILKLTSKLDSADPDILLTSGPDLKRKKDFLDAMIRDMAPSGGVEVMGVMIDMFMTDNPTEAHALYKQNEQMMIRVQKEAQAAQQQAMQMQAQVEQQKNQIPLQAKKIEQETAFGVQNLKSEERQRSEDTKGNMSDIKHYQNQDNAVLKSDLHRDEQAEMQQMQLQREAQLKAIDNSVMKPNANQE